mgnify:CR=1 FL=1
MLDPLDPSKDGRCDQGDDQREGLPVLGDPLTCRPYRLYAGVHPYVFVTFAGEVGIGDDEMRFKRLLDPDDLGCQLVLDL